MSFGDDSPNRHVKNGVKIMNNIPNNQWDFARQRRCFRDMELADSALRINISPNVINISLDVGVQDRTKLKDVLIGPV